MMNAEIERGKAVKPYEAVKITDHVYWVGAIDWNLRNFHGYNTLRGSTYNAFLITGEKPILIDTVKAPFFEEMMSRIRSVIEPEKIQYIISNHSEMDHSACIPRVIENIKPDKVFASKMGAQALEKHFHRHLEITEIKSGEKFELGDAKFTCLETRMLHWPDSMSQHKSEILRYEAAKYYANILLPYSDRVLRLLDQFPKFNLEVKIVAPDHGPLWDTQENIQWIMNLWRKWAEQKPEQKITIVYDTMWESTAKMAQAISDGARNEGVHSTLFRMTDSHRADTMTAILESGALLIGTPTLNQQMFPTMADVLCYLKGLKPKNLIGQVFGSYGWGQEGMKLAKQALEEMQVKLIGEPVAINYVPTDEDLIKCRLLGQQVAKALKDGELSNDR